MPSQNLLNPITVWGYLDIFFLTFFIITVTKMIETMDISKYMDMMNNILSTPHQQYFGPGLGGS